jgi:hypothetical protein
MALGDATDGLAAFTLATQILLTLESKGIFSSQETKEIVEVCLANLETQQAGARNPAHVAVFRNAREPLEHFATVLSQRPKPQTQ